MGQVFHLLGTICLMLGMALSLISIFSFATSISYHDEPRRIKALVGVGFGVLCMVLGGYLPKYGDEYEQKIQQMELEHRQTWEQAIENGYTFYLEGEEIDPGTIDYEQYRSVSYDDEEHKVFIVKNVEISESSSSSSSTLMLTVLLAVVLSMCFAGMFNRERV